MNNRQQYAWWIGLVFLTMSLAACGGDSKGGATDDASNDVTVSETLEETTADVPSPEPDGTEDAGPNDVVADIVVVPDTFVDTYEDTNWTPDWTDNPDPLTEGCLEFFPAICNEINECKDTYPLLLTLPAGLCAPVFDGLSGLLTLSCEELGNLLSSQLPDAGPIAGEQLGGMIANLLNGCIKNFNCDLAFVIELGTKFGELAAALGVSAGGQGGQIDFLAALPAIIELAQLCGGVENILPF